MTAERNPLDRYDSPDFMTLALLEQHPGIGGKLCVDPCCGDGRMAVLLAPRFKQMLLNDIDRSVEAHSYGDARSPWTGFPVSRAGEVGKSTTRRFLPAGVAGAPPQSSRALCRPSRKLRAPGGHRSKRSRSSGPSPAPAGRRQGPGA